MSNQSSPSRPRDRAGTEAAIVEAATRLLLREGWPALNVQTVAGEAGVDRKLVYRYFDGVDGVVDRIAAGAEARLSTRMEAAPRSTATTYRDFTREMLAAWLGALRADPVALRLLAWESSQDTPLLRRLEARRSAVLQAWTRERRPRLRLPPSGDLAALSVVLLAAVQQLAVAEDARSAFGGILLDDTGWARIEAAVDRLVNSWPD